MKQPRHSLISILAVLLLPASVVGSTFPISENLLDRNPGDGEACRKLCYTFGANVRPPFRIVIQTSEPEKVRLDPTKMTDLEITGGDPQGTFSEPRVGPSGNTAVIDFTDAGVVPDGTTICYTITESFFVGMAAKPGLEIDMKVRRLPDGSNADLLGNVFLDDIEGKFDIVFDEKPKPAIIGGGEGQAVGKVKLRAPDGVVVPPEEVNLVVANGGLNVQQNPENTGIFDVLVPGDPKDIQEEIIAAEGWITGIVQAVRDGQTLAEEEIKVSVRSEEPPKTEAGTRRGKGKKTSATTLHEALEGLQRVFFKGDPVSTATGAFFFEEILMDLGGPLRLEFSLAYSSDAFEHEPGVSLPQGFEHNHWGHVAATAGPNSQAFVTTGLGREFFFERSDHGPWLLSGGEAIVYALIETGGHYTFSDPATGRRYVFKKLPIENNSIFAPLVFVSDSHENRLTYTQGPDPRNDGPAEVRDGIGRLIKFSYEPLGSNGQKFLSRIEDQSTRAWTFQYEINPEDNAGGDEVTLRSVTDPLNGKKVFTYAGKNRIAAVQMPAGNTPYTQTYGDGELELAVATQSDALGNNTVFTKEAGIPGLGSTQFKVTNPDGSVVSYFHTDNATLMSAITDELGNTAIYRQDGVLKRIDQILEPDGMSVSIDYNGFSGQISGVKNTRGESTAYQFAARIGSMQNPDSGEIIDVERSDLVGVDYADGSKRILVHDALTGSPVNYIDRDGNSRQYTYDSRGNVLTQMNGEEGVRSFTYDMASNRATSTDEDTGVTTHTYDVLNRRTRSSYPDGSEVVIDYDDLDRVVHYTDERGIVSKFDYDANGNVIAATADFGGALEQRYSFDYDDLDRLVSVTDPAGHIRRLHYPYHDSPDRITEPGGTEITLGYDLRRALVRLVDQAGHAALLERDYAGRITKVTSPEGRERRLQLDALGAVIAEVDPSGDATAYKLDISNRRTGAQDRLGRQQTMERDGAGRVKRKTEPVIGDTLYDYDKNGRLVRVTDPRGKQWEMTYTRMGRLAKVSDPLGNQKTYDYDERGRRSRVLHPDGIVETLLYDPSGNRTRREFSDELAFEFNYDRLGRRTEANPAQGQGSKVSYTYDNRNNPTGTTIHGATFTGTFDERNDLVTLDYAGEMLVTYVRDARGLVTRVSDSKAGAQIDIEYNKDRQITKLTRSNGLVTNYVYDGEGRVGRLEHQGNGTIDFAYTANDEPASIVETGFPEAAVGFVTEDSSTVDAVDDADQITSAGYEYDPRGRPISGGGRTLTWDSADRLVQVSRGGDTIAYTYTPGGNIASRSLDGDTTQYCYSRSVATRPILAERAGGVFRRFYVALPDGSLLYCIDLIPTPSVKFYHFGKVGETRFLSDSAGAISDAYAYDGFGRLVRRSGTSDQIYAFVGELGVRYDSEAGLIHMRARYYDPDSGRFLSRDPSHRELLRRGGQNVNPYHYVEGMPTWVVDPTGRNPRADRGKREPLRVFIQSEIKKAVEAELISDLEQIKDVEQAVDDFVRLEILRLNRRSPYWEKWLRKLGLEGRNAAGREVQEIVYEEGWKEANPNPKSEDLRRAADEAEEREEDEQDEEEDDSEAREFAEMQSRLKRAKTEKERQEIYEDYE